MQHITPNLWFQGNAEEAVALYTSAFPDAKIVSTSRYPLSAEEGLAEFQQDLAGKVLTIDFSLFDFHFTAINAGPEFTPNPSISFFVTLDTKEEIDTLWEALAAGGQELMPRGTYPFSAYYGWVQDRYNVSWQLILNKPEGDWRPKIVPSLLFTQAQHGHAEEALAFYTSVFTASTTGLLVRRTEDDPMAKAGTLLFGDAQLGDTWIAAMDGGEGHPFTFSEGVSLMISCEDQAEIDHYWNALMADGGSAQVCGWLKDKFGVSWQVVPTHMEELMKQPNAFKTLMGQTKIIVSEYMAP